MKRTVDIVVSLLAIIVLAPVMLVIAIVVKLDTPGPVLFRSRRIGREGEPFGMLKFRTMVADADSQRDDLRHLSEAPDGLFKIQNDPRLTRFGRYIRATSLDELPQLFQVLTGTMSLVGPAAAASRGGRADRPRRACEPRPAQASPAPGRSRVRGGCPLDEMVRLDHDYVANWSRGAT